MWALRNENWIQPQKACGSDILVPHEELVRLLKDRGSDSLMDLLKRNIRSNDPISRLYIPDRAVRGAICGIGHRYHCCQPISYEPRRRKYCRCVSTNLFKSANS